MEVTDKNIKTIIIDINLIPSIFTKDTLEDTIINYGEFIGMKIVPIDSSRQNTQGSNINLIPIIL